jgi:hypothetical protein
MARRLMIVLLVLIAFGGGWVSALIVPSAFGGRIPSDWFDMSASATSNGSAPDTSPSKVVSYSFDAFAKADIPLPEIKAVKGSAKFVTDESSPIRLGYKTSVEIEALDLAKVPEKYQIKKKINIGGGKAITQLPIDQVTYEATFSFALKDRDGFTLLELLSASHTIRSGKINTFQALATEPIAAGIASRTAQVILGLNIMKCVTCE